MVLTTQQSALTQNLRQNANYLQLGGVVNWLYAVMTIFAQRFNICSSNFERSTVPIALLVTHRATATDGHMFLSSSFCCKCKPLDSSRRSRKDKFVMVSKLCNQQHNA